jgi:hypothetical protein
MTTTAPGITKELVIDVSGDIKGKVEICQTDTLKDVRALILEEFDDDMIPFEHFCFHVNGVRISEKQECKNQAWDLSPKLVSLHSKLGTRHKLESSSTQRQSASKHGRSDDENHNEMPAPAATLPCAFIEWPPVESSNASDAGLTTQSNHSSASTSAATKGRVGGPSFAGPLPVNHPPMQEDESI